MLRRCIVTQQTAISDTFQTNKSVCSLSFRKSKWECTQLSLPFWMQDLFSDRRIVVLRLYNDRMSVSAGHGEGCSRCMIAAVRMLSQSFAFVSHLQGQCCLLSDPCMSRREHLLCLLPALLGLPTMHHRLVISHSDDQESPVQLSLLARHDVAPHYHECITNGQPAS